MSVLLNLVKWKQWVKKKCTEDNDGVLFNDCVMEKQSIDSTEVRYFYHNQFCKILLNTYNSPWYSGRLMATGLVYCLAKRDETNVPIEFPDSRDLSHEQLIKQACTATVNSASQLLTSTLVALIDVAIKYRKALEDQLSLIEESLVLNDLEDVQQELNDLITEARCKVDLFRRDFMELSSLMDYVEKVVESTTETSFLAGAEVACTALSERLHSAKTQITEQKLMIKRLEEEMVQLQTTVIKKTSNKSAAEEKS